MSRGKIANHGLTGSLPTAVTSSGEATHKLNRDNAKQFGVGAGFKIVQDFAHVVPMQFHVDWIVLRSCSIRNLPREFFLHRRRNRVGELCGQGRQDSYVIFCNFLRTR